MSFTEFLEHMKRDYQDYGVRAGKFAAEDLFRGALARAGVISHGGIVRPPPTSVVEQDWDLFIVLDACRYDAFTDVADEYEFLDGHRPWVSYGATSREFIRKTYCKHDLGVATRAKTLKTLLQDPYATDYVGETFGTRDDISDIAYVTGNPFSRILQAEKFHCLEEVWRTHWDDEKAGQPPRTMTDHAIDIMRNENPPRMMLHYMQPHIPFRQNPDGNPWVDMQRGEKPEDELWDDYKDNMRWVLDEVELLLENIDADKVVITSDHANAVGEWGCYGHHAFVPVKAVREVPWVTTTATDEETYEPDIEEVTEDAGDSVVESRLQDLGYM